MDLGGPLEAAPASAMIKLYGGFARIAGMHPESPRRDGAQHNDLVDTATTAC
jgi:hypothetical protein